MRRPTRQQACALLLVLTAMSRLRAARATIFWDDCQSEAQNPGMDRGDLYNLCIRGHIFSDVNWSWKLTMAEIQDTQFNRCYFTNMPGAPNSFTEASWSNVEFNDCLFGSIDSHGPEIVFDKTALTNVAFSNCVFDHSVNLVFREFAFNNVSFTNCSFRGDTLFTLGEINTVSFVDSFIRHNDIAETTSGNDSFTFRMMTINNMLTLGSQFLAPFRFEGVNAADVSFNESTFNSFTCHNQPNELGDITLMSNFNNSIFQTVRFDDQVLCDQTTWRGMFMANVSFYEYADFSGSKIGNMHWDYVTTNTSTGACHELNFTRSAITHRVLANTSVDCIANFEGAYFKQVFVKNFFARRPIFTDAVFHEQEYIDGQCCSTACIPLSCLCNITYTSGNCPVGMPTVNLTAAEESSSCFPAEASVQRADGSALAMSRLTLHDRIAIGRSAHSEVFFFGHRDQHTSANFLAIAHSGPQRVLTISPGHYLYVNGRLATARTARKGDFLHAGTGEELTVRSVRAVSARGLFAPATLHGDLVVDGVLVSSYTDALHPRLAHWLLHPLRLLHRTGWIPLLRHANWLHTRSAAPLARLLGLPRGPDFIDA